MTSNTVSANLNALLDPLDTILNNLSSTIALAFRNKLPAPYIATLKSIQHNLDGAHDELLEVATTLDPSLCQPER